MADDDRALVRNAADPRQVKNAERKEKRDRDEELSDLRELLATAHGRRVLWRLLGYCKVFAEVFDDSTPSRTAFNAGARNVGLFVLDEITAADETGFFLMMQESRERERKRADEAAALRTEGATDDEREP